ncbi:MAG: ATP-dependent Clp protease ATP-binding subunit [bacterium]
MAYRYYGDPNKALPIPGDVPVEICRGSLSAVKCRVFDGESKINKEIFAFGIDDVLLRAAKRKNLQSRTLVSTTDFIAGFLRKGTLTRTLLKEINLDPDQLYTKLEEHVEQESGTDSLPDASQRMDTLLSFELDNEDEEAIQKHVDNWIISRKNQCTSDLIDIFLKADELSQQQDSSEKESPISEANVLECLIYNPLWKNLAIVGLPSEEEIGHLILKHKIQGKIDENGELILAKLDDNAKKIIKAAHNLSQQRGVFPIPNRVLFASFLIDEKGYLNRICNQKQIDVAALFEFLMGVIEDNSPLSFGLSVEACERIVLPVIEKATELAHDKIISEKILFRAFCECANSEFKSFVKTFFPEIDLDNIESTQIPGQQEEEPTEAPLSLVSKDNANQSEMPKQDQFDSTAWNIIMESAKCAFSQGWNEIKSPHLFAALITSRSEPIETLLRINAIKAEDLKSLVLSIVPARPSIPGSISTVTFSRNTFKIIRQAVDIARSVGHPKVGVQELFAAFFADGGGIVGELFNHLGIRTDENNPTSSQQIFNPRNPSLLSMFGVDLTEKAKQGLLSEIVGREDEIQTALQTLLLTENANPLLVGEAGVGKTAIVEGIAQRIVQKRCPKNLQSKRIIELSAGGLVANTSLRGEFEQRIQGILAEAKDDVILFIDEIHTLVGAGSGDGRGPDAANMLKAALARGSLRLIGATTYAEYKKTIARDKALSRRFQVQIIGPTSRNATVQILSSRKKIFEKHHGVEISVDTIEAATDLSGRYIVDKHWPAKARDVLERACVLALVESETKKSGDTILVSKEHVVKVIANSTGIPIERLTIDEQQTLAALEQRINRRIIGQPQAIHTLVESIRKGRQGLASLNKPWGAFLCVGPPGVGKTELAKILAEEIFGGTDALIRFDMGDFTEAHSTAKLIGAPPGYIGFDQGSPLIDKLRMHPYSVILFDEIEHAHENVLAVLLRLLSEGTISDNEGNIADARNTIVIMTSNKLSQESQSLKIGFVTDTVDKQNKPALTNIRTLMAQHFPPKFIDRLDGIIEFKQLTAEDLLTITTLRVQDVVEKVYDMYNLSLTIEPNVTKWILEKALNEDCGARSIQRTIDNTLIAEIMRFLGSEIGKKIDISIVDNSIKAKLVEP